MIEYFILEKFSPFLLGYCNCGCCENLPTLTNHGGKITKFILGHHMRVIDRKGFNHPNYTNGRVKDNQGYWRLTMSDYYCADSHGRVREHVYNFQEYNKLCMLPWGHIHHKDGNKENNMPWNLRGMMNKKHIQIHFLNKNKVDFSDRICFICKSNKTTMRNQRNPGGVISPHWCHLPWDKENWYCKNCYRNIMRRIKKNEESP